MKSWCCLVVFESLLNSTVDDNLVILKFPTNHSEGRVQEMVVNVNLLYQRVSKTVEFGSNISEVFVYNRLVFSTFFLLNSRQNKLKVLTKLKDFLLNSSQMFS